MLVRGKYLCIFKVVSTVECLHIVFFEESFYRGSAIPYMFHKFNNVFHHTYKSL